jgi:hypothetical protein
MGMYWVGGGEEGEEEEEEAAERLHESWATEKEVTGQTAYGFMKISCGELIGL